MTSTASLGSDSVNLQRVTLRLNFPPSYAVVGAYRLCNRSINPLGTSASIALVGALARAAIKSLWSAQYLHKPYFKTKKMTPHEIAVFIEERKWDYISYSLLLEGIPITGLAFTVSNRIGAAMWAHDLEKRKHNLAELTRSRHREKENKGKRLEAVDR